MPVINHKEALKQAFVNRLVSGLKHVSITSPSKWATTYRMMPDGLWTFDEFPWTREMHDSRAELNVGQKAAQMGFTETLLNLAFYVIDILGKDVMYVLPTKTPGATNFSSGRFDPALELSPYLRNLFSDVDNIGHKRAGAANLYVVGSHSRADLKSAPISELLMDEVAEFVKGSVPLALQRISGQKAETRQAWLISTPTFEGHGISQYYNLSDKGLFVFKCPSCSRFIDFKYPESLVICGDSMFDPRYKESHLICTECKAKLPHEDKRIYLRDGVWQPQISNATWRGFSISQLYSMRTRPQDIALTYFKAQTNPAEEQELWNSVIGKPHETKGARVSDSDIDAAILNGPKNRMSDPTPGGLVTMGIDVGKWYHYEVAQWKLLPNSIPNDVNTYAICKILKHGKCKDTSELEKIMLEWRVLQAVMDVAPDFREGLRFSRRFPGQVHLCRFSSAVGKSINVPKDANPNEPVIHVDRTCWLDEALGRFHRKTITLPIDTNMEYREHLKIPVKMYEKDQNGNPVAKYISEENDDHYAFSRCYNEIALVFAATGTSNITSNSEF